ncbi:MAG: TdeIII family type II restriction endonuclease [Crocinitomicaceae bacterium]|nr:TdeIII family type II restriction endonuclease [Crocinitomicaceae bacterium]NBY62808.1 TdeIII family type II restriction endonuclease [Betaproteobacteria bacterium]
MPLSKTQKNIIKNSVEKLLNLEIRVQEKSKDISRGDTSPFLISLLGTRNTLLVKVGQSIQTTMGMSFYEQTCKLIGENVGFTVELQKKCLGFLSEEVIQYLRKLDKMDYVPNRMQELEDIRNISKNIKKSKKIEYPDSTVDVYITTKDKREILIDITTVKPNKKEFRIMKQKTLRWAAYRMSQDPEVKIEPYFAIPYNPEGSSIDSVVYTRFKNYYDRKDILVGDELWKKISNNTCSINDVVGIFNELGDEMGKSINKTLRNI